MSEQSKNNGPGDGENLPARRMVIERAAYEPPAERGYLQDDMDEPDSGGLIEYWRLLRRRKGTLILIAGIGLLAGILVTLPQTPVYQARTTLEVMAINQNFMGTQQVQAVQEASDWSIMTDIQTQIKIIQSQSLATRVVEELGVGKQAAGGAAKAEKGRVSAWRRALNLPDEKAEDQRTQAVMMAAGTLKARASGQTKIIELTVDSTDPKVAAEYANALANQYIGQNIEARWKLTQRTGEFLSKQLDEMRVKLERSEDSLQEYARRMGLVFTGGDEKGGRTNITEDRLRQVQEELTKAQGDRMQKQSRWELASSAPADSLPDVLNDGSLREYQTKLTDLRRQQAELGETFTAQNPKVKRVAAQIASVEKSLDRQRADILKRIKNDYDEAVRREKLLDTDYQQQTGVVTNQGEKSIKYNILRREAETNRQLYESMLQRMKEASLAAALRASNIRVVDPANAPDAPYKPRVSMNALLGLMGGIFVGVGFILMTEKADRTLQEPADIAFYLQTAELGMIPSHGEMHKAKGLRRLNERKKLLAAGGVEAGAGERLELATLRSKNGLMAESFRATLTSILFSGQNGRPRVLAVTSPSPSEGKTTVVSNLAIAMAETGQRVLLIDADMRKPRVHDIFSLGNGEGLTTLLLNGRGKKGQGGEVASTCFVDDFPVAVRPWELSAKAMEGGQELDGIRALVQGTEVPGLYVLTSGPLVAGPTNLLYSSRLAESLEKFKEEFDMIFIDTPPMLQIPDARVIGRVASGVILVVRAGKTTRDAAVAARTRLREDGVRIVGTVMNDWNPKRSPGGYYGYYDGYHRYYRKYGYTNERG